MDDTRRNIKWKNIFYFISYCNKKLEHLKISKVDFESVESLYDLMGVILNECFEQIEKFGYLRTYEYHRKVTDKLCGSLDILKSYNSGVMGRGLVVCNVHELMMDNTVNQIIKLAFQLLLSKKDRLSKSVKKKIVINIQKLSNVHDINIKDKRINQIINVPKYYEPALEISKFVIRDWILSDKEGKYKLYSLSDKERIKYIWEEFLRNYIKEYVRKKGYKIHVVKSRYESGSSSDMDYYYEPDIKLFSRDKDYPIVILDAKWYEVPEMKKEIYKQLSGYANDAKDMYNDRNIRVSAVFGYGIESSSEELILKNNQRFRMFKHIINVDQDFKDIKKDIGLIVENQLK